MIIELTVSNLGVIDTASLELPEGMIALTGETGAGKTLLVDAINLLVGGRADPGMVRAGADEATIDGRFEYGGEEYILTRVIQVAGRSKGYINGRPATAANLAELGAKLVDLHGQHTHQSLLAVDAQRDALDTFGSVDLTALDEAKAELAAIDRQLADMGGDPRDRARELDLVRYQANELESAVLSDPQEDDKLKADAELLANAVAYQETADSTIALFQEDDGVRDVLARALSRLQAEAPFAEQAQRLSDLVADLDDITAALRRVGDGIDPDPEALDMIQTRRKDLHDLRRKYGDTLVEVIAERDRLLMRLKELEDYDIVAAGLDQRREEASERLRQAQAVVRAARVKAAPDLAAAIESHLPALAMARAQVGVEVEGDDGSMVSFQLAANPGSPLQPLSKVASGGELARTMLALRSVLSQAPPVLIFDEVDAGIGGQAGSAVGRALSALGDRHQVLVVTHLPQVAAFADAHITVEKQQGADATVSNLRLLDSQARVTELARMLSGQPDSDTAQLHAQELMEQAQGSR